MRLAKRCQYVAVLFWAVWLGCGSAPPGGGSQGGDAALTGRIRASGAARRVRQDLTNNEGYTVIAQSNATGELYRGMSDAAGDFEVDIPQAEAGNTFVVTILSPDGRAVGPVLFAEGQTDGVTGVNVEGQVSLGTVDLPEDPLVRPIRPGSDATAGLDDLIDPDVSARLDDRGVPVGLASHGKGDQARSDGPPNGDQLADGDRDGLIDTLDADDDGDGLVDDFEGDGAADGLAGDLIVNFFMNLKIGAERAGIYYSGNQAEIAAALATDTIITFEVMMVPGAERTIAAAHMLEVPGPPYMPIADKMGDSTGGLVFAAWVDLGYAFDAASDRFQAFVRPNAVMDAGDTFTVEVVFDDGSAEQHSRMINYVFKNIPRLVRYGAVGSLSEFDVGDPTVNGTPEHPIWFDGTQDLVLIFNPPLDETGAYLTDLDYTFQVFYHAASDGRQLNGEIDVAATWPTLPAGFDGGTYWVPNSELVLADDNTYSVTIPKEILPDEVQTAAGPELVDYYKIDITAECSSGNAALMLAFKKQ
ncbi:MAG: hypothetical protein ACE5K7_03610 [Phycisphaerae bacterium]